MSTEVSKSDKGWIAKSLASGSLEAIGHKLTTYLLPLAPALVTGALGLLQGIPWMWVMVGTGLMFSSITTFLLRFDEWRTRNRVEDKLGFVGVRVVRNIRGPGILVGFVLQSAAHFPLQFEVTDLRTRVRNRVPADHAYEVTRFVVPPHGGARFDDHVIEVDDPPKPGSLEGFLEAKIRYGRPGGKLRYEIALKKRVLVAFDKDGLFTGYSWDDAA